MGSNQIHKLLKTHIYAVDVTTKLDISIAEGLINLANSEIDKSVVKNLYFNAAYALLLKNSTRFLIDRYDHIYVDEYSVKWSPKFYKIWNALPVLENLLKDKSILDPFGGSGLFSYYFLSSNIARSLS